MCASQGEFGLVGGDRGADQIHAQEQQSESEHRVADAAGARSTRDEAQGEAQGDGRVAVVPDAEGEGLHRQRGAEVGAHDDREGLDKGHEPRVDEADQHHHGRSAVREKSEQGAEEHPAHAAARGGSEQGAQALAGGLAETFGHDLHAEEEQRQPARHLRDGKEEAHGLRLTRF